MLWQSSVDRLSRCARVLYMCAYACVLCVHACTCMLCVCARVVYVHMCIWVGVGLGTVRVCGYAWVNGWCELRAWAWAGLDTGISARSAGNWSYVLGLNLTYL